MTAISRRRFDGAMSTGSPSGRFGFVYRLLTRPKFEVSAGSGQTDLLKPGVCSTESQRVRRGTPGHRNGMCMFRLGPRFAGCEPESAYRVVGRLVSLGQQRITTTPEGMALGRFR